MNTSTSFEAMNIFMLLYVIIMVLIGITLVILGIKLVLKLIKLIDAQTALNKERLKALQIENFDKR
ncbi:hypothetical protein U8527_10330 [Kordia algicida OT-1]|uniref:Uncharacterized protein n=1 Tax=Kordia algicida OT-1 TaxID=391587 RepID=A9DW29_9FLAO|nr:hypothetical protein [Kordia algicida]EDP96502.1 hypothetical protein KAOT1_03797 [Kordia algicida OT-1]